MKVHKSNENNLPKDLVDPLVGLAQEADRLGR